MQWPSQVFASAAGGTSAQYTFSMLATLFGGQNFTIATVSSRCKDARATVRRTERHQGLVPHLSEELTASSKLGGDQRRPLNQSRLVQIRANPPHPSLHAGRLAGGLGAGDCCPIQLMPFNYVFDRRMTSAHFGTRSHGCTQTHRARLGVPCFGGYRLEPLSIPHPSNHKSEQWSLVASWQVPSTIVLASLETAASPAPAAAEEAFNVKLVQTGQTKHPS